MDERRAGQGRAGGVEPDAEQVLAAVRRAMLHRLPHPGPAPLWSLLEHLAIPRRSAAARLVPRLLAELERDGLLEPGREHGLAVWSLTPAGERALARAGTPELPESPRKRRWRHARIAAAQELPRFRARLGEALAEAEAMLAAVDGEPPPAVADRAHGARSGPTPPAPRSEAWLELGRRLDGDCRRLGSAWHCLREWPEPADDAEDPDAPDAAPGRSESGSSGARRARLAALRNVRLWRERD